MGSTYLLSKGCRSIALLLSFFKESKMVSFKFLILSVAINAFVELVRSDDDPEATKCYCYVAMKKQPGGQGLHAQQAQFEGDCIQKGDRILTHPGIDVDELPSCSNQEREN